MIDKFKIFIDWIIGYDDLWYIPLMIIIIISIIVIILLYIIISKLIKTIIFFPINVVKEIKK